MRHVSVEPPPFFHRGPSPLARLAFFGVLSLALLFADTRFRYLEGIRAVATIVLTPLHRAVQIPGEMLAWIGGYFASKQALSDENAAMKQNLNIVRDELPNLGSVNAESVQVISGAMDSLVGNAEDAKGSLRGLRDLAESAT